MANENTVEKFSWGKWIGGLFNPITWSKSVMHGIIILIIVIACVTIYRAYFKKTGGNISKPDTDNTLTMLPGSKFTGTLNQTATVKTDQKVEPQKKPLLIFSTELSAGGRIGVKDDKFEDFEPEFRVDVIRVRHDWN